MSDKNKKETAEQKLLKMIETAGGNQQVKAEQKVLKKQTFLSVLKMVNQILTIGVVCSVVFLAYEIFDGVRVLSGDINISADQKTSSKVMGVDTTIPTFQNASYYLAAVARRNIFQPIDTEKTKSVASTDKNSRLAQLTQNLKLVGVSWLSSVESASVMIEDTDKKVTYFLQKGEKVGDITVKTIYADSAVLGYGNEEITIKYDKPQM